MPRALPHSVGVLIAALGSLAVLTGCGEEDAQCTAMCVGELEITFADGREEFSMDVDGSGFSVPVNCPGGSWQGNVYGLDLVCGESSVTLMREGDGFPSELTILVDGERWDETPDYTEQEECGSVCESASLVLE